ncbi:hypothetical protein ABK040_011892 [Willaertia magna]
MKFSIVNYSKADNNSGIVMKQTTTEESNHINGGGSNVHFVQPGSNNFFYWSSKQKECKEILKQQHGETVKESKIPLNNHNIVNNLLVNNNNPFQQCMSVFHVNNNNPTLHQSQPTKITKTRKPRNSRKAKLPYTDMDNKTFDFCLESNTAQTYDDTPTILIPSPKKTNTSKIQSSTSSPTSSCYSESSSCQTSSPSNYSPSSSISKKIQRTSISISELLN